MLVQDFYQIYSSIPGSIFCLFQCKVQSKVELAYYISVSFVFFNLEHFLKFSLMFVTLTLVQYYSPHLFLTGDSSFRVCLLRPPSQSQVLHLRLEHSISVVSLSKNPNWAGGVPLPFTPDVNFDHLARELSDFSTV